MKNDENIKKSFWSVTPATVRYDEKLPDGAKLLYGEISALCNERGYCWASNEYFAQFYKNDARTIRRWVSALADRGHVYVKISGKSRKIFLMQKIDPTKFDMPEEFEEAAAEMEANEETPAKEEKPKKKMRREFTFEPGDMELAKLLHQKICFNFPAFENKKINLEEWADELRKLRDIDHATAEQIMFMIMWVHGGEVVQRDKPARKFEPHEFWARNIMSAKKLRKQWFDNLVPQLQQAFTKAIKKSAVADLSGNAPAAPKKTHQVAQL